MTFESEQLVEYYSKLCSRYPILSIEDGMAEDDWDGWRILMRGIDSKIQIV